MTENRKYYRSPLPPPETLTACVLVQQKEHAGRITDISASGMGLLFDEQSDPGCIVGESTELRLKSPHLDSPLSVPSQVIHVRESRNGQIYGFGFLDWLGLRQAIPKELVAVFNQRGEYRVEPDPDHPIAVTVTGIDLYFEVEGQLRDISSAGMSFRAPALAECVLRTVRNVKVSFSLGAEPDGPLSFVARICHRDLTGSHINYGLSFLEDESPDFASQREVILAYVTARRREGLEQKVS